jgi:trk system potassium uptake protein
MVLGGAAGLKWLPNLYTGEELSWLDAIYTSTSAVCVTGLVVVDTATYFTFAGQLWILALIQIGGLGIITFTSLIIIAIGRRLSLRSEALSMESAAVAPHVQPAHLLRDVVLFTFSIELLGAIILYAAWVSDHGWIGAIWPAVFHSVSAFCNAGFSVFPNNLIAHQDQPFVLLVIGSLIILGGIGFLTMEELYLWWRGKKKDARFRLSLHSRLVLMTTLVLILVPWPVFAMLEWNNTLTIARLGWLDKLVNTLFLSITPRTAGYNSIDYAGASIGSNFMTILLMGIGGSPGSTAGGLKTTTVALIGLLAWSRFRNRQIATVASRSIPEETIQRAVGLFVVCFGLQTLCILLVSVAESRRMMGTSAGPLAQLNFLEYMFECVSAFNTVGLSMGISARLGDFSKWIMIALMFIGRVGPLVFAAALALPRERGLRRFRYAYEDVVVG